MDIITLAKLKKCISIDMNAGHSFATTTDRDTFFTNNPTQLKADMYIYCNSQLQQYVNSAWEVRSTAIQGSKGDKGDNGITPHIDLITNNWFIDTIDTGIKAIGLDGIDGVDGTSPHIGINGNWYIGTTDTGVKAVGVDGVNGTNGINGADGVGIQTVIDNGDNTFTVTLTNGAFTVIDKIDTINSDVITQGTTNLFFTTTEKNKLTRIEENAEVNNISDTNATDLTDSGDTTLHYHASDRDRTNHTGVQTISTITGLQTALDNKANKDFTLYTQKSTVSSDDKIAINDSEDTNSVKYVTLNQLISSVQDPHNKGYFETGTALNTAIPTAIDGDFAVVGATNTVWVWSTASSDFVDSGANGAVASVNGRTGIVTLTKADVGLNNVVNLDTSNTANITDSEDKRFVTDTEKITWNNKSDFDGAYSSLTGSPTIPSSTSDLTNDSGFLNSIPDEYINETELTDVLSLYALTASIPDVSNKLEATNLIEGTNVTLDKDGNNVTINATGGGSSYTLPAASAETLGGVKVGAGLSVTAEGVLSASGGGGITQTLLFGGATNATDVYTLSAAYTGFKFLIISAIYTGDNLFNTIINCADIRAAADYSKKNSLYIGGDRQIAINTNGVNFKTFSAFTYCKIYGVN